MLGLVQVESGFRKYAISIAGARGYTQVMPFWARLIGDGDAGRLFHMQTQPALRLRDPAPLPRPASAATCFLALGRYNGSRGRPDTRRGVRRAQGLGVTRASVLAASVAATGRPRTSVPRRLDTEQGEHPLDRLVDQLVDACAGR